MLHQRWRRQASLDALLSSDDLDKPLLQNVKNFPHADCVTATIATGEANNNLPSKDSDEECDLISKKCETETPEELSIETVESMLKESANDLKNNNKSQFSDINQKLVTRDIGFSQHDDQLKLKCAFCNQCSFV